MTERVILALSSCPDDTVAQRIATALVSEGLAACVSRIAGAHSTYHWEGQLQEDTEVLLIIKTTAARLAPLTTRLAALHPYQLPELVAVEAAGGNESYLDWVRMSVGSTGRDQETAG